MKRIALAMVLAALPALAQSPAEFRSNAEVTPTTRDALHRFTLPVEAYRDARRDLADLRVFNSQGETVPFAIAGEADQAREAPATAALAQFPVFGAPAGAQASNLDVSVRTRPDGTVISVRQRSRPAPEQRPVAWLLDASAVRSPLHALILDWEAGRGAEIVRVGIEASDDLKSWQTIASQAVLVRVEQGGQVLSQPRVEFARRTAKYLRVTGASQAFQLKSARAEMGGGVLPLPREKRTYTATAGAKPGEYAFDLGARLPVESVRVAFAVPNSVAPVDILSRDVESAEWRFVASGTFYRLTREGAELESPALDIGRRADRYWMLRIDPRSGGVGASPPSLEVAWRAAQVVFVARGEPPFRVAFGSLGAARTDATRTALPVSSLIPGYERNEEHKLPAAVVGAVQTVAVSGESWRKIVGDVSPRKLGLWSVLLLGVAFLGFMAWRLSRQMQAPPSAKP
jgi:hypothetical protein